MLALEQDEGQKLGGKSAEAARFILRADRPRARQRLTPIESGLDSRLTRGSTMPAMDDDLLPDRTVRPAGRAERRRAPALRRARPAAAGRDRPSSPATGATDASQLEAARTIARLRELEVPLEEIREVLATDDPAERRAAARRPSRPDRGADLPPPTRPPPRDQRRRTAGAHRADATRSARARPGDPPRARGRPVQPHLDAARDRTATPATRTTR